MSKKINIQAGLKFAWEVFTKNLAFFVSAMIGFWILASLQVYAYDEITARLFYGASISGYSFLFLITCLLQFFITIAIIKSGFYYLEDNNSDPKESESKYNIPGLDVKISKLFISANDFLKIYFHYIIASILFSLIVAQGFLLLIIPGIYFAIKCIFYMFYVIDKKTNFIKALEQSYYDTSKKEISILFALFLLSSLVMFSFLIYMISLFIIGEGLAVLILVITLSIITPINLLALSHIYKNDLLNEVE